MRPEPNGALRAWALWLTPRASSPALALPAVASKGVRGTVGRLVRRSTVLAVAVAVVAYGLGWRLNQSPASATPIPIEDLQSPPADAEQLIVVSADGPGTNRATLQAFTRAGATWHSAFGPMDARIGRNGFRKDRHEGDGTSPVGTFTLTEAFGIKPNPGTVLPYRTVGTDDWWVSDVNVPDLYNTWQTHAAPVPWDPKHAEHLITFTKSYDRAVVIDFNRRPSTELGRGSGIFLHVDNGNPTSGCVAIDESQLADIMRWLDPTKRPQIMMGTLDQLLKVNEAPPLTAGPSGGLRQVTPTRILDTRIGLGAAGPLPARTTLDVTVPSSAVPSDAVAVALNVTLTEQTEPTYLTVYPTPADPAIGPPLVSNVNAVAGEHRANLVFVRVGDARRVRVYNPAGRAQVVADVVGYVSPNALGRFLPVTPYRVLDTRYGTGAATIAKIGAREAIDVPVPFAPANATAAVVNVTVTDPTSATWVAAYQGHGAWGGTSTVNTTGAETSANLAIVPLADDRTIRLQNANGASNLLADVQGFIVTSGSLFIAAQTPVRVLDTRNGIAFRGRVDAAGLISVLVPGLPADASAVAMTITAVQPSAETFIRAVGSIDGGSQTSNLNLRKGDTRANLAIVPVGIDHRITLTTHVGDVDLIADVSGWFAPG